MRSWCAGNRRYSSSTTVALPAAISESRASNAGVLAEPVSAQVAPVSRRAPTHVRPGTVYWGTEDAPPHAHVDRPHAPGGEIELIQHDVAVPRVVVPCLIALEAVQWEPRLGVVLAIACGVPSTRPGGPGVEVVDGGGEGARAAHEPHWVEAGDVERRSPGGAEVPERVN